VHGQAEDPAGGVLADGEGASPIDETREGRLQVQGLGIIDRRGDAVLVQFVH